MPIDAGIPLQAKGVQLESPMNQLAMMSDAMKIGEMQRGIGVQNKLRDLYAQGIDPSTPEGFKQHAAVDPIGAMKFRTDALQGRKLTAETGLKEFELDKNKIDRAITDIANHPDANSAFADIQKRVQAGELPVDKANFIVQQLKSMPYEKFQMTQVRNLLNAKDRLTLEETQRSHKVTEGIAGGHLQIARENQQGVAQTLTDSAGNVTLLDKQGNVMKQLGPMGKPSATFEKTAALQKQQGRDLSLAISELTNATKDGGLIDKSTGSGIGRFADVSAGFIGQATPGAIAIAKLKPIADIALKMVPRFEGPQSDKDTQSYKEAAGQLADPSLPTQTRKEAGKEVLRLMKARKGQFVNEVMANEGIGAGSSSNPNLDALLDKYK